MISYAVAFKWENDWQPFSGLMILYAVFFLFLDIFCSFCPVAFSVFSQRYIYICMYVLLSTVYVASLIHYLCEGLALL